MKSKCSNRGEGGGKPEEKGRGVEGRKEGYFRRYIENRKRERTKGGERETQRRKRESSENKSWEDR